MKAKKIDDNTLEFRYSNIISLVIVSLIFLGVGGFLFQKGYSGDWQGGGDDTVFFVLGSAFLIVGLLTFIFGPVANNFRFDKSKNQIYHRQRRTFGLREYFYELDNVDHLAIRRHVSTRRSSGSNSNRRSTQVNYTYHLIFKDHREVRMAKKRRRMLGKMVPDSIADVVEFLDVPLDRPPSFGDVAKQAGQAFDVVKNYVKENRAGK